MIYLLKGAGATKIGFSGDQRTLSKRIASLQTAHPVTLKVIATYPWGRKSEKACHRLLDDARVRGEWFQDSAVNALAVELECFHSHGLNDAEVAEKINSLVNKNRGLDLSRITIHGLPFTVFREMRTTRSDIITASKVLGSDGYLIKTECRSAFLSSTKVEWPDSEFVDGRTMVKNSDRRRVSAKIISCKRAAEVAKEVGCEYVRVNHWMYGAGAHLPMARKPVLRMMAQCR